MARHHSGPTIEEAAYDNGYQDGLSEGRREVLAEAEKWLITIEAHCTVIDDPSEDDDTRELTAAIRSNVQEIRQLASQGGGDAE